MDGIEPFQQQMLKLAAPELDRLNQLLHQHSILQDHLASNRHLSNLLQAFRTQFKSPISPPPINLNLNLKTILASIPSDQVLTQISNQISSPTTQTAHIPFAHGQDAKFDLCTTTRHLQDILTFDSKRNHQNRASQIAILNSKLNSVYEKIGQLLLRDQPYASDCYLRRIRQSAKSAGMHALLKAINNEITAKNTWIQENCSIVDEKARAELLMQTAKANLQIMKETMETKVVNNDILFKTVQNSVSEERVVKGTILSLSKAVDEAQAMLDQCKESWKKKKTKNDTEQSESPFQDLAENLKETIKSGKMRLRDMKNSRVEEIKSCCIEIEKLLKNFS